MLEKSYQEIMKKDQSQFLSLVLLGIFISSLKEIKRKGADPLRTLYSGNTTSCI